MTQYQIDFEPIGPWGTFQAEQSLLEVARQRGIDVLSLCGGIGACQSCTLQLLNWPNTPSLVIFLPKTVS